MKTTLITFLIMICAVTLDASARYRGDLNDDGRVNLADMGCLAKAIEDSSVDMSFDVNCSGTIDNADLHKLADIIISGRLTEDSGLNVGIGGWDDSGEDYGGAVKAPAFAGRSAADTRFYVSSPRSEGDYRYSLEFGICDGCDESPSAILLKIRFPSEIKFDSSRMVELNTDLSATHGIYGTPKVERNNEYENILTFIIFSPDFDLMPVDDSYGRIFYSIEKRGESVWGGASFEESQILTSDNECMMIPEHDSGYWGSFEELEVTGIWLDTDYLLMGAGNKFEVLYSIEPDNVSDSDLIWTSSDESVATVSIHAPRCVLITAIRGGVAVITVTAPNGISASCTVEVLGGFVDVDGIYLDSDYLSMNEGESASLTATIDPADATEQTVRWFSSDDKIAVVHADGLNATVYAVAPGVVEVGVEASNGIIATCLVTVEQRIIEMEYITLDVELLALEVGDTHQFVANVFPAETTYQELEWWIDNEEVATVDNAGFVTMIGEGSTTVHVRSAKWHHIEASCRIDVSAGVVGVTVDEIPSDIYSLDGKLLMKDVLPTAIQSLDSGIYIINGIKIRIR